MDKSQYFYRIAVFTRHEGDIGLVNVHDSNRLYPLDEWLGTIINLADGQHTIGDFIAYISQQYAAGPPEDFDEQVEQMFQHLMDIQSLRLATEPVELPYYLSIPAEDRDIDKAKALMLEDGFIPKEH